MPSAIPRRRPGPTPRPLTVTAPFGPQFPAPVSEHPSMRPRECLRRTSSTTAHHPSCPPPPFCCVCLPSYTKGLG